MILQNDNVVQRSSRLAVIQWSSPFRMLLHAVQGCQELVLGAMFQLRLPGGMSCLQGVSAAAAAPTGAKEPRMCAQKLGT